MERDTPLATEGGDLLHNTPSTSGLTDQRDVVSITTKKMDIFRHPFNSKTLIIESGIADTARPLQCWAAKKSEGPKAIVDLNENDALVAISLAQFDEATGVASCRPVFPTNRVASAIDPGPFST